MSKNIPCPRCGKTNPADVHTCTPKQDQSIDLNSKPPFIRLTDEEILEIVGPYSDAVGGYTRKLFDTIQDKLEEKNK
jgi:hypothetical protein